MWLSIGILAVINQGDIVEDAGHFQSDVAEQI